MLIHPGKTGHEVACKRLAPTWCQILEQPKHFCINERVAVDSCIIATTRPSDVNHWALSMIC